MFKSIKSTGIVGAFALFVGAGFSAPTFAVTDTATFNVTITITDSCSITTGATLADINFGSSVAGSTDMSTIASGSTSLQVQCNPGTSATIGLSSTNNPSSTDGAGIMQNANADSINYQLYQGSGLSTKWGSVGGANDVSLTGDTDGTPESYSIYADITDSGTKPSGAYSDTVTVTVSY